MMMVLPTNEVWSLSDAGKRVREGVGALSCPADHGACCFLCGAAKDPLEFMVTDAPQFYELCTIKRVIADTEWVRDEVTRLTNQTTVTILKGRSVRGHMGGRAPEHHLPACNGMNVLTVGELTRLFSCMISISFVAVGTLLYHIPHVSIGSLVGKAAVSAVLGRQEAEWAGGDGWKAWVPTGWSLRESVVVLRYVDDEFIATKLCCTASKHPPLGWRKEVEWDSRSCSERYRDALHQMRLVGRGIPLDKVAAGAEAPWLDFLVQAVAGCRVRFLPVANNSSVL